MNVNVSMKKLVIAIVLIAVFCGSVAWYMETAPERKTNAEIKVMIKFAQRQALEIAIIEQSSKLANYKQQMAAQKPKPPIDLPVPAKDIPKE